MSVLLVMLAALFIVRFNGANRATPSGVVSSPSPQCRKGDPIAGVYNPLRFRVLVNCQLASGVVKSVTRQPDGDQRIGVGLDSQYLSLLNAGNTNYQNRLLALELTLQDQSTVLLPAVGQHVRFVGPLVYDIENQWNAVYPVWSIQDD